jgi:hypothetical protein
VIVIQRVRVRWNAAARGAPSANLRRGLDRAVPLPAVTSTDDVVVHEVLADEATGYQPYDEVLASGMERGRGVGLWLAAEGSTIAVDRLPGPAAYPRQHGTAHLFTLLPGQVGRYRANFRFTGCACNPSWFYENWLVHVSNGPVEPRRFVHGMPDHDVDHRVHLYGGGTRSRDRSDRQSGAD